MRMSGWRMMPAWKAPASVADIARFQPGSWCRPVQRVRQVRRTMAGGKLPTSLRAILMADKKHGKKASGFPQPHQVSYLARQLGLAGTDVDQAERLFRTKLITGSERKRLSLVSKDDDVDHLKAWRESQRGSKASLRSLERLTGTLSTLEDEAAFLTSIGKISYFATLWRLMIATDDIVTGAVSGDDDRWEDELQHLEAFAHRGGDLGASYFFWVTLLHQLDNDRCLEKAASLLEAQPRVKGILVRDSFELVTKDYDPAVLRKGLRHPGVPSAFCLGETGRLLEKLRGGAPDTGSGGLLRPGDPDLGCLEFHHCLALWNTGKRSEALEHLQGCLGRWLLSRSETQPQDSNAGLGVEAVQVASRIVQDIVGGGDESMEPAARFLDVASEKLAAAGAPPILPYLHLIHLEQAGRHQEAGAVSAKYPGLAPQRDLKFERSLYVESMTNESKAFFIADYLKKASFDLAESPDISPEIEESLQIAEGTTPEPAEDPPPAARAAPALRFSPSVQREMLDISILEELAKGNGPGALGLATNAARASIFLSDDTLKILARAVGEEDKAMLAVLRTALPPQTPGADLLYEMEVSSDMKEIYSRFRNRHRGPQQPDESALEAALMRYQSILEEDYLVQFDTHVRLLRKVRLYLRLFMEELLQEENWQDDASLRSISAAESWGKAFADNHGDFDVVTLYWEVMFFSDKHQHQMAADEFLRSNPKVPQYIDVDNVLVRAAKYKNDDLFQRRILEICLQFDLDAYDKCKAMEGLLLRQCERGNLRAAAETLRTAENLGIQLGADAVQAYLDLKAEMSRKPSSRSFLSRLFVWDRSKKQPKP